VTEYAASPSCAVPSVRAEEADCERFLHGFDVSRALEVRIRSYTLGPGRSAQLVAIGLEVEREDSAEPDQVEIDFEDEGPTLATAQALVATLNRRLRERRGEGR
jgi:uncharacterized protein YcbX